MEISKRQMDVLSYVTAYRKECGRSPTRREIAQGIGVANHSTVAKHVRALVRKGWLFNTMYEVRGLRLRGECRQPPCPDEVE